MRKIVIIAMLLVLLNACQRIKDPMSPEPKPGSRNYIWELDTLDMPMNMILSVWGASPKDVWAVGPGGTENDHVQHYDGVKWSAYTKEVIGCGGETLFGFSADNVWIGGQNWMGHGAAIWHYDGVQWSQHYNYDIKDSYALYVCDIWGSNPNDIYASGVVSFFDGTTDDFRGFLLHFNGEQWREVVRGGYDSQFLSVRKESGRVYLFSLAIGLGNPDGVGSITGETRTFYEVKNNKLVELFSVKGLEAGLYSIGGKVLFVIDHDIFRYVNGKLVKYLSVDNENFWSEIYGRSDVDLFLKMKDGLAHYNGENIEYLYTFPQYTISLDRDAALFEKEVFFCGFRNSDFKNIILHGRLVE